MDDLDPSSLLCSYDATCDLDDFLEMCDDPASNWPWIVTLLFWWAIS